MFIARIASFVPRAVRPPFVGLAALVWGFFVWCYLIHPDTPILAGRFVDSDDMLHLLRVIEWLKGQSWFDPVLHRLAPPEGVAIHYSRLAELPLAAMIWPLVKMGVDYMPAALVAAFVWPLVLLVFFFRALRWLAQGFVPRDWERATAFVALFALPALFQFSPGRVDHHGLALILMLGGLGGVLRLMRDPRDLKWAVGGGFSLALGQAIALETLPWMILLAGWLGLWTLAKGRALALPALLFGVSLYTFSALLLLISVGPSRFYAIDPLSFSYAYVLLAGALALGLAGAAAISLCSKAVVRWGLGVLIPAGFLYGLVHCFPAFLAGPYAAMDPDLAKLMMNHISEALPLARRAAYLHELIAAILFPLAGLCAALFAMSRAKDDSVWSWVLMILLLLASLLLLLFYQIRVQIYAAVFAIVPLTALLHTGLAEASARLRGRKLAAAEFALILLVGPLLSVFVPAAVDGRSFNKGVLLFPMMGGAETMECSPSALYQMLNLPQIYGNRPRLILNTIDLGGPIIFRTPHSALAAPYHTNVKGNLTSMRFFAALDFETAKSAAKQSGAELVVMCTEFSDLYINAPKTLVIGFNGEIQETKNPTVAQRLAKGETPNWLKKVDMPLMAKVKIYEILRDKLGRP